MYKKIMVPTDGSGFDREAIRVALRIAERSHAAVRLVRVNPTGTLFGMETSLEAASVSARVLRQERDRILGELDNLAAECRKISEARISTALEDGPVPDALRTYASGLFGGGNARRTAKRLRQCCREWMRVSPWE